MNEKNERHQEEKKNKGKEEITVGCLKEKGSL